MSRRRASGEDQREQGGAPSVLGGPPPLDDELPDRTRRRPHQNEPQRSRENEALQRTGVGGAVVGGNGRVVGIATPKLSPGGVLALPVATVNRVVDALLQKGRIPRGYLGVGLQPIRLPENLMQALNRQANRAVMVLEVEPSAPAHKAGVVIGDILVSLNGKPVLRLEDVQSHLTGENIGKDIRAGFLRGGAPREVTIVIGERKNEGE